MLTDLSSLKSMLDITDGSKDAVLSLILAAADGAVKGYCGRDFEATTYPGAATNGLGDTGYYTAEGLTRELWTRQTPLTAVASIYSDADGNFGDTSGAFASGTLLTSGIDYAVDWDGYLNGAKASFSGRIFRLGAIWPQDLNAHRPGRLSVDPAPFPGSVRIAYTAGFPTGLIPPDLSMGVLQLAVTMYRGRRYGGTQIINESLSDYSYQLAAQQALGAHPELGSTRQVLGRYRRIPL